MKHKKLVIFVLTVLMILPIFVFCFSASAAEKADVAVPISVNGADCTVVLENADGVQLQSLLIKQGETDSFKLSFDKADTYTYRVHVVDKDTDRVTYDKSVYDVSVYIFELDDGSMRSAVIAEVSGGSSDEGKPDKLVFNNNMIPTETETTGRETEPSTEALSSEPSQASNVSADTLSNAAALPQTGTMLWLTPYLLIGGLLVIAAGILLKVIRREDKREP